MNAIVETINSAGRAFVEFALPMFIQSSVLILILLALDVLLRRRVRAVFRYWIWMLVLLKLVLPPSLGSPISIGTWLGETLEPPQMAVDEPLAPQPQMPPAEWQPQAKLGDGTPVVVDHIREMQTSAPGVAAASDRVPTPEEAMSIPETPSPAASALGWQAVVLLVWLAVVSALLLLLLQRAWFVRGLVTQAQEAPSSLRTALDQCRSRMGVARPISLRLSPNATSPAVCGLLRPVILIPQNLAPRLQPHDVQAVLLHELAHIKRGDLWVNLIQTLLQIVYFYNPLLWLANAMIRRTREQAVDEAALVAMGETASDYPETLLHIAKLAFHRRPALSLRLIGVVESKSALSSRIKHILAHPLPKTAKLGLAGLATVAIIGAILLPMARAERSPLYIRGIDERLGISDKSGHLTIRSLHMAPPDGRRIAGINEAVLSVRVENTSPEETYLGLHYYANSGMVAGAFSPGSSSTTRILPVPANWQGTLTYPIRYAPFVRNGLIEIRLAKCRDTQVHHERSLAFLPPDAEVLHDKSYSVSSEEESEVTEPTVAAPDKPLYEKAKGSRHLKTRVGPHQYGIDAVVRWDRQGSPVFEDGRGRRVSESGFATPDYSRQARWMDIANIYLSPESELYDVLELRVFDHETKELLQSHDDVSIGYDVRNSIVQLRSSGGLLPDAVDVWFRLLHNPLDQPVWRIEAQPGASADLDRSQLSCREIREGAWSYSVRHPPSASVSQIQWGDEGHEAGLVCTAVFDFGPVRGWSMGSIPRYQICAISTDGERFVPDYPHFIASAAARGDTKIVVFDLPADKLSHFEVRPFNSRDRFYFEAVRLPRVTDRPLASPPPVVVPVHGRQTDFTSDSLLPARVRVQVLPGRRATGISNYANRVVVKMREGPIEREDTETTFICRITGLSSKNTSLAVFDQDGRPIEVRRGLDATSYSGHSYTVGLATVAAPITSIGTLQVLLGNAEPTHTSSIPQPGGTAVGARLSDGVTVELLGVCEHPSAGCEWWRPDGSPLDEAPHEKTDGNVYPNASETAYEFAVRLHDLPDGAAVTMKTDPGGSRSNGTGLNGLHWLATALPNDLQRCQVLVGIAAGAWDMVARTEGETSHALGTELGGVMFTQASEHPEEGVVITVTDDIVERLCRMVAVTKDARTVVASRTRIGLAGNARQTTAYFKKIAVDEIAEFQFQTRPWTWVTFSNVSLKPGHQTNITVDAQAAPEDREPQVSETDASAALPLTARAKRVMPVAEQEARRLSHAYVGTEHILLALARQEDAVSAKVLANLGADIDTLRAEVNKFVQPGARATHASPLPRLPRALRVMPHAREEAQALHHDYIGTEHLLLALLREPDSVAAQVLAGLGIRETQIRSQVLTFVHPGRQDPEDANDEGTGGGALVEPGRTGGMLLSMASRTEERRIAILVERLASSDQAVWKEAAEELREIGPKVAGPLSEMFRRGPKDVRVLEILKPMATSEHVQAVMRENLELDPKRYPNTIYCSLIVLGESGNRVHVPRIARLLNENLGSGMSPTAAIGALRRLGGDEAFAAIRDVFLRDVSPNVIVLASQALVGVDDPNAIPYLEQASEALAATGREAGPKRTINGCIYRLEGGDLDSTFAFAMPVFDRNIPHFDTYIGGNLTRFDADYVDLSRYGLEVGVAPEVLFEKQGQCAFYMRAGHEFVPLHGTVIAPLALPELDPNSNWTGLDRLKLLYPSRILDHMRAYRADHPYADTLRLEDGGIYAVIIPERTLLMIRASFGQYETGAEATSLTCMRLADDIVDPVAANDARRLAPGDEVWYLEPRPSEGPADSVSSAGQAAEVRISGRVLDPNGVPAAGAQVAWIDAERSVSITDGRLMAPRFGKREGGPIIETDAQGRFRFEEEPNDGFSLLAAHEKGFALVGSEQFAKDRVIRLQRWGRIEGQVAQGREPMGDKIWMGGLPNSTWFEHRRDFNYETLCDAQGRFTFKRVPPGWFEVGYLISNGDFSASLTSRTPVVVEPGQTATMTLGGEGRPVVGRFVPPPDWEGPIYFGAGLRALATARPDPPRPGDYDQMTNRQQQDWLKQWYETPEAKKHRDAIWQNPDQRHYTFRIAVDGTFRIEDVIPGKYSLNVGLEERLSGGHPEEFGGYSGTIEVPPMDQAYSDEPLDVGDLVLRLRRPLHTGDMAPSFEAETIDGKPIRLADYRGRFVLLNIWSPVFNPELDRIKELHATYRDAGKLQIIGLGGTDTLDEVKKFIEEHDIEWPEIYFGRDWDAELLRQLGGQMQILLIDPDGKIVATWLREETLTGTVREALAAFTQD